MNILSPEFATYVCNCYQMPVKLLISGGKETQSNEGNTQSDPVVMGMYATGVFPSLHLKETSNKMNERTKRLASGYNLTGAGKLLELQSWWDSIVSHVDYSKASKSYLTVKEQYFNDAIKIFEGTGVKITVKGR